MFGFFEKFFQFFWFGLSNNVFAVFFLVFRYFLICFFFVLDLGSFGVEHAIEECFPCRFASFLRDTAEGQEGNLDWMFDHNPSLVDCGFYRRDGKVFGSWISLILGDANYQKGDEHDPSTFLSKLLQFLEDFTDLVPWPLVGSVSKIFQIHLKDCGACTYRGCTGGDIGRKYKEWNIQLASACMGGSHQPKLVTAVENWILGHGKHSPPDNVTFCHSARYHPSGPAKASWSNRGVQRAPEVLLVQLPRSGEDNAPQPNPFHLPPHLSLPSSVFPGSDGCW